MKKLLTIILVAVMALSSAVLFVACGDKNGGSTGDNSGGASGDSSDGSIYTVTVEESDFYEEQGGTTSSSAGIGAYVKIVPKFTAISIDNVFYNG